MSGSSGYDWEAQNRQTLLDGQQTLLRANQSIVRSQQVAIETEHLGTEVLSDLNDQRETLLRTKSRLTNADEALAQSRSVIRKMSRNIIYNKLILILIILLEIVILIVLVYHRFFQY